MRRRSRAQVQAIREAGKRPRATRTRGPNITVAEYGPVTLRQQDLRGGKFVPPNWATPVYRVQIPTIGGMGRFADPTYRALVERELIAQGKWPPKE